MYKVVTNDLKSLGLRKNPMILTYRINKWLFSPTIKKGKTDDGGIWCCKSKGNAIKIQKYMLNKHNIETKIFVCEIGKILYKNSYRIKTNKLKIINEI